MIQISMAFGTLLSFACERASQSGSASITVQAPANDFWKGHSKVSAWNSSSGLKACYGAAVSGSGIANQNSNSCTANVGITTGTVEGGGTLVLSAVPKGTGRTFDMFVVFVDPDQNCPSLASLLSDYVQASRVIKVGTTAGVNLTKEVEDVVINLVPPNANNRLTAQASGVCLPAPQVRATLLSNGDVLTQSNQLHSESSPVFESIFSSPIGGSFGEGAMSAGGDLLAVNQSEVPLPPWLRSLTRKPDLGTWLALDHDGGLYSLTIDRVAGVINATRLTDATCPFDLSNCSVPPWIQSVSAGFGRQLFGIDHEGSVYGLSGTSPSKITGLSLGPQVAHFSFY